MPIYLTLGVIVIVLLGSLGGTLHYYKSEYRRLEKSLYETENQLHITEDVLDRQSESIRKASKSLSDYESELKNLKASTKSKNIDTSHVKTCEDLRIFLESLNKE